MSSRIVRWTAAAALALLPTAAAAQIEITPFVASYFGVTNLWSDQVGGSDAEVKQKNSFGIGGRITVPVNTSFKVEGEFAYDWSGAEYVQDDFIAPGLAGGFNMDGTMMFASIRALFSPRRSNLYLLAGPAWIKRGGDAWDCSGKGCPDLNEFGGVVGLGINANVTPKFRLNLTAETYLYSADLFSGSGLPGTGSEFQADILVSVGVPIKLGGN